MGAIFTIIQASKNVNGLSNDPPLVTKEDCFVNASVSMMESKVKAQKSPLK